MRSLLVAPCLRKKCAKTEKMCKPKSDRVITQTKGSAKAFNWPVVGKYAVVAKRPSCFAKHLFLRRLRDPEYLFRLATEAPGTERILCHRRRYCATTTKVWNNNKKCADMVNNFTFSSANHNENELTDWRNEIASHSRSTYCLQPALSLCNASSFLLSARADRASHGGQGRSEGSDTIHNKTAIQPLAKMSSSNFQWHQSNFTR